MISLTHFISKTKTTSNNWSSRNRNSLTRINDSKNLYSFVQWRTSSSSRSQCLLVRFCQKFSRLYLICFSSYIWQFYQSWQLRNLSQFFLSILRKMFWKTKLLFTISKIIIFLSKSYKIIRRFDKILNLSKCWKKIEWEFL